MTDLTLTVDLAAPEPPYEQVRAQLAGLIGAGTLAEGDRLPTVRALAADLGLAVNTVARAGLSDSAAIDLVRAALREARA